MFKMVATLVFASLAAPSLSDTELLMAEQAGCHYCEIWNKEIGPIYPKTAEGRFAPLRRYDIHAGKPEDAQLTKGVNFTPTFILLSNGQEVGRIEGYPGEDFFWGLLELIIKDAGLTVAG